MLIKLTLKKEIIGNFTSSLQNHKNVSLLTINSIYVEINNENQFFAR